MFEHLVMICAYCQQDFPEIDKKIRETMNTRKDIGFSHGICRRHFAELLKDSGASDGEIKSELDSVKEAGVPDLKQHPELVKQYSQGNFTPEDYKKDQFSTSLKEAFQKRANIIS
jgi:hypothetical protein